MVNCQVCTFENQENSTTCEICEALLNLSVYDKNYTTRWQDAKILVIGAAYGKEDQDFWSITDKNYIGIGMGDHNFKNMPHWQTNWNTNNFWDFQTPPKKIGFKYIFLDRCVWNIVSERNFKNVLQFALNNLQINGCFLIPKNNWETAQDAFMKQQFIQFAKPECRRKIENKSNVESVQNLIAYGQFMIVNGYSTFHDENTNNLEQSSMYMDRTKWKSFIKMKPMI